MRLLLYLGLKYFFWDTIVGGEWQGIVAIVVAVVCLALTNIIMRLLHKVNQQNITSLQIVSYTIIIGTIPIVVSSTFIEVKLSQISFYDYGIVFLNAVFSICLVMFVFNFALKILKAFEASIIASCGVIFTALFSSWLLDSPILINEAVGIAILFIGIYLVQKQSVKLN